MKITIFDMLPSNDLFVVMKENDVKIYNYIRWNHGTWSEPLKPGEKIVSEGIADARMQGEKMYSFRVVNVETDTLTRRFIGISESNLIKMLDDETLDYQGQFCGNRE